MKHPFLCLLVAVIWLLPSATFAQIGPFLRVDYTQARHQADDLNDFIRSYNAFYGSNMARPLQEISPTQFSHLNYGAGFRLSYWFTTGLYLSYGTVDHRTTGEYQNGIQTRMDIGVRDLNLVYELGVSLWNVVTLQGVMAGYFRKSVVDVGYVYQDGTYSIGNEYDLLSVHQAWTTSLDLGWSVGLRLGRFHIPVTVTYPNQWISDEGLLTFLDYDERQIRWSDLPRDYATWAQDPANLDLDNGFVRAESLRSFRITVGLEVYLISQNFKD